jgi:hypothetical protein
LSFQSLLTISLCSFFVNVFDQVTLISELISLHSKIETVIETLVDLALFAVLAQKAAEDSEAAHPLYLYWASRVLRTLALTLASVAPLSLRILTSIDTST